MKQIVVTLLFFITVFATSVKANDSLKDLVNRLDLDKFGLWKNGTFPMVKLAESTPPTEVIREICKESKLTKKGLRVVAVQKVSLENGTPYQAALLELGKERRILLFNYVKTTDGKGFWWSRFFSVKDHDANKEAQATPGP